MRARSTCCAATRPNPPPNKRPSWWTTRPAAPVKRPPSSCRSSTGCKPCAMPTPCYLAATKPWSSGLFAFSSTTSGSRSNRRRWRTATPKSSGRSWRRRSGRPTAPSGRREQERNARSRPSPLGRIGLRRRRSRSYCAKAVLSKPSQCR